MLWFWEVMVMCVCGDYKVHWILRVFLNFCLCCHIWKVQLLRVWFYKYIFFIIKYRGNDIIKIDKCCNEIEWLIWLNFIKKLPHKLILTDISSVYFCWRNSHTYIIWKKGTKHFFRLFNSKSYIFSISEKPLFQKCIVDLYEFSVFETYFHNCRINLFLMISFILALSPAWVHHSTNRTGPLIYFCVFCFLKKFKIIEYSQVPMWLVKG